MDKKTYPDPATFQHPEIIREILAAAPPNTSLVLTAYLRALVEKLNEVAQQRDEMLGLMDELAKGVTGKGLDEILTESKPNSPKPAAKPAEDSEPVELCQEARALFDKLTKGGAA